MLLRMDAANDRAFDEVGLALERMVRVLLTHATPVAHSQITIRTLCGLSDLGPTRVTELARFEHITQPAMSQLVSRLEAGGLIMRARDPADSRAVLITITDAGRRLVAQARAQSSAVLSRLAEGLGEPDRAAILHAAESLNLLAAQSARLGEHCGGDHAHTGPGPA